MPTPHIEAKPDDYAKTVLLPGDPLRAKYIAEHFLDDVRQVTAVRNMYGFTGTYRGVPVSVQGSGMGIPSMQIYATELAKEYDVKEIIRVGSCGGVASHVELRDIIIASAAGSDSGVNRARFGQHRDFPAVADYGLLSAVATAAEAADLAHGVHVGPIFSSDSFYGPPGDDTFEILERYGILGVEMEAAGLYGMAAEHRVKALTVATVSDLIKSGEHMSPEDRQSSLSEMITIVLEAIAARADKPPTTNSNQTQL